jgi:hypothetical protein
MNLISFLLDESRLFVGIGSRKLFPFLSQFLTEYGILNFEIHTFIRPFAAKIIYQISQFLGIDRAYASPIIPYLINSFQQSNKIDRLPGICSLSFRRC